MSFHSSKIVVTKKEHRCTGCYDTFPAGTKMKKVSGHFDGDFYYGYLCNTCSEFLNKYSKEYSIDTEGFLEGSLKDFDEWNESKN
jgi:hypothetical protein